MFNHKNLSIFTTQKSDGAFSCIADYQIYCQKESGMSACEQYVYEMEQTHSVNTYHLKKHQYSPRIANTDGIITSLKPVTLLIKHADCIPLVIFDENTTIVAVIHAGWRGLLDGIHLKVVRELIEVHSIDPKKLHAWIGPSIRSCCYVFSDKPTQVEKPDWKRHIIKKGKKWHIDLVGFLKSSFVGLGINQENIRDTQECTYHNKDKYLSYLRHKNEGDISGNMLTVVQLR